MYAESYARAHKLLSGRAGGIALAHALGVVHSLLILLLLTIAGLLASLLASQGESRVPSSRTSEVPRWVAARESGADRGAVIYGDTGLYSVVAGDAHSRNWFHYAGSRFVGGLLNVIPTLRNNVGSLASLLAGGLGVLLATSLVASARRSLTADLACDASTALRRQIHRQTYRLGQSALPTEGTGPILNLLTREVNDVRDGLFAEFNDAYRLPVLAAGLLLYALCLSWVLTLFLIALGILVYLTARVIHSDTTAVANLAARDAAVQLTLLHEDVGLLRTVRVYGMEGVDRQRFDEHLEGYRDADARRLKTEGQLSPTSWLLFGAAVALAVGLLGFNVVAVQRVAPASALVLTAALAGLTYPILSWVAFRKTTRQASRSAASIFEFLERKTELHQQGGAHFLPPMRDRISLEDVTLESRPMVSTGPGRVVLSGVSVEFPAGTRTAIMSLDEDAKHALVCLIPRLIDPKSGRVRIDGHDLRDVTLESIRAQVATVLQADLVFTDTVLMNISLGDPSYPMPRVLEAAKLAHAHHFVQDLPHGYDTVIGPLGHYLTVDQQYRIALARAALHDPSIVIIEEPAVGLDEDMKHLFDDTLARLSQGRTLIILPHRLSTIRSCQQVIVLHGGRVEIVGNPRQLQHDSKLFRHMQYLEFNQFATGEIEVGQMTG